jgi:hypothetical protein
MECPKWITENGFEFQFQVNYLSHYLLTRLLINYKSSIESAATFGLRVINVTSTLYKCKIKIVINHAYSVKIVLFFFSNIINFINQKLRMLTGMT